MTAVLSVVHAGIGNPSIWDDLEAQSLLGVEGFAEGLRHLVTEKQQIREMPKGQRFVGRPSLERLFSQRSAGKVSRDRLIAEAVTAHGYSQKDVASFLHLHYSTISRILAVIKCKSKDTVVCALDELQMRGRRKFFSARTSVPT